MLFCECKAMTNEEKIKYLNEFFNLKGDFNYHGPNLLYKYRAFDQFTFDMLENDYVYLCPAEKLDDPLECDVSFDMNDIYDLKQDRLKRRCVDKIVEQLKPYTTPENYQQVQSIMHGIMRSDGTVSPLNMLDASQDLKELAPEVDVTQFVNLIEEIPARLDNPSIKPQLEFLLERGYHAKEITGICSLAESNKVIDMWEKYAQNSSGYCIEYDVTNYEFNAGIFPVIYQDNRETNVVEQLVGNIIGQTIFGISNGQIDADKSQYLRLFLTKNTKWSYQNEWRLIGEAKDQKKAPKILRIYLGKNCSDENKQKMKAIAKVKGFEIVCLN